jgi:Xaa-Pro aminopeptidase
MGSSADAVIAKLRKRMKKEGIFAYYIPTSDFHASEYVNDYFKVREFFSGFTGSAGDLLITKDEALLWTDGRYFIQAERELEGSGIRLMKSGEENVPDMMTYIKSTFAKDAVLGFDGRTVSVSRAKRLKKSVPSHRIAYRKDLSEGIFERPAFPKSGIEVLPDEISGESSIDRIAKLREELKKEGCDAVFLSRLDDIAYLFNIRAHDIRYTPVAMAYAYITLEKAFLFLTDEKAETGYPASLVKAYDELASFLKSDAVSGRVMIDNRYVSFLHYRLIKKRAKTLDRPCPVELMKAVKNSVETEHIRDIYLKDSVQLTRFIRWITTTDTEETEMSAAARLLEFRKKIPEFREPSFETISAYGDNAAIIHYAPGKEHDRAIEKKGLYMVDSGGQYEGGTTDVTRTIVMGELTDEEKEAFTLAAAGMLKVMYARFMKGSTGVNLDILARERLWKKGIDYKHGTGHGVGYMLSVHEGPQAIRQKYTEDQKPLQPGMLISDEPGVYKEGKYGVRCENILLVKEAEKTEDGTFYDFESLTLVPLDDNGIDRSLMTSDEIKMYERYQREVYDRLAVKLDADERSWLYGYAGLKSSDKEA